MQELTSHPHPAMATHSNPAQREQARMPVSQLLPGKGLTVYFPSFCLRVWFPINLHLGTDCNPPLWVTDGPWHTLNYGKVLRTKKVAWTITKV